MKTAVGRANILAKGISEFCDDEWNDDVFYDLMMSRDKLPKGRYKKALHVVANEFKDFQCNKFSKLIDYLHKTDRIACSGYSVKELERAWRLIK